MREVNEVVQTASKTVLAKEKIEQMDSLLAQPLSVTVLASLLQTHQDLRKSLRSAQMKKYSSALVLTISKAAQKFMEGGSPLPANSASVDVLLEGLTLFEANEGVPSLKQDLKQWMTEKASEISHGDVLRLLQHCSRDEVSPEQVDFSKIAPILEVAKKQSPTTWTWSTQDLDMAHVAFRKMLHAAVHKVGHV